MLLTLLAPSKWLLVAVLRLLVLSFTPVLLVLGWVRLGDRRALYLCGLWSTCVFVREGNCILMRSMQKKSEGEWRVLYQCGLWST